jgi:nucleotide-binding universal stress UspA family protein
MMPEIKKILYTTDLSKNSAHAFGYAVYLANNLDAEIVILHVVERMSHDAELALRAYLDKKDREKIFKDRIGHAAERIKNRIKLFCEKELETQPEDLARIASIEVCEGYPAEEILRKSETFGCDIILMGTHEKGFTSHTFLGSVAKRVLRRSRKPAFVVPLPQEETDLSFRDT